MTPDNDKFTDHMPGMRFDVEPEVIQRDGYVILEFGVGCRIYRPVSISSDEMSRRIDEELSRPPRDEP